jgi:hypothetical protein
MPLRPSDADGAPSRRAVLEGEQRVAYLRHSGTKLRIPLVAAKAEPREDEMRKPVLLLELSLSRASACKYIIMSS